MTKSISVCPYPNLFYIYNVLLIVYAVNDQYTSIADEQNGIVSETSP